MAAKQPIVGGFTELLGVLKPYEEIITLPTSESKSNTYALGRFLTSYHTEKPFVSPVEDFAESLREWNVFTKYNAHWFQQPTILLSIFCGGVESLIAYLICNNLWVL
jgi:hypothetical protein